MTAAEAADFLDVKRETLYAYVSRGWLESVPHPQSHRARLYRTSDLRRLRARAEARTGEGAVAATALQWGAPVLETSICEIRDEGPAYRGEPLSTLLSRTYEQVAGLLVGDPLMMESVPGQRARLFGRHEPLGVIRHAILETELRDEERHIPTAEVERRIAGRIFGAMVSAFGIARGQEWPDPDASIAARTTHGLGGDATDEHAVRVVELALIVSAEHELNVSAFAARVAASTGANLYACVSAALAAFSGARHGSAGVRVRRLLRECASRDPAEVLRERLRAGEAVPGFGHPLYADGDPRFGMLWDPVRALDPDATAPVAGLVDAAAELGLEPPNLDVGLVAVSMAANLIEGAASGLFAVGRTAGWLAHAREQRRTPGLLRPRAKYVGE